MTEALTIARALIDPEDLRGTVVGFERAERPGQTVIATVQEPLTYIGSRKVTLLREPEGDGHLVNWEVLLLGGDDKGLRFEGIAEELKLRYGSPARPQVGGITDYDTRSYWGA